MHYKIIKLKKKTLNNRTKKIKNIYKKNLLQFIMLSLVYYNTC